MSVHLPFILVEVVLVFGAAMAFAWWQFRDLRKEREKREQRQRQEQATRDAAGGPDAA